MDPPGHGGSSGRWRQARCRGKSPGMYTPSATGGERRQSRLVLGLFRLGERLPALAWGMARCGRGRRKRGKGKRTGWGRGRVEGDNMGLRTEDVRGRGEGAVVAELQGQGQVQGHSYRTRARARAIEGTSTPRSFSRSRLRMPNGIRSGRCSWQYTCQGLVNAFFARGAEADSG